MFLDIQLPPELIRFDNGQRVFVLRRSLTEDAAKLIEGVEDSLAELKAFMPWAHFSESNTLASQTERIQGLVELWDAGKDFTYNLFLSQDDGTLRFVGCLGLHPRCLFNHGLEIGYWVRTDAAGQGLCTLAAQMSILAGFRVMGLKRIQVGCDVNNAGSRRVIEKVGFQYEGRLRNNGVVDVPAQFVADGLRCDGDTLSYGLIPEDLEELDWVDAVTPHVNFESL